MDVQRKPKRRKLDGSDKNSTTSDEIRSIADLQSALLFRQEEPSASKYGKVYYYPTSDFPMPDIV